ncbi:beta-1,6-N-acetylglucosaminyltransferase [Gordonia sp. (in: high G+C Gram-positive bacteria)]|jgi:hypothetical protein|uniref:beta-1,6-N-acetylglucosaminyltransferase n=1 Tax=Gordonia sp. (in: high G+C Gram-positive bacteria) TaxID=84139 RepID=UPI001E14111C|nr:beta-1,6-N-acetylglucosaminyltransferase [Gordonia sp. (in: high G+C Gram-positive bacteria)]MCB1296077.1 glycosyltransferase [Gordonia sp. (in: high G+C Gram-positive bacteria)]HMS76238.1 beta-1,6-N-acetylglucosaminyltransferase [Gordonia sp. (in: high G+C Gram-positive bacteria)]HQV20335.1 beta-1,6-N-acetylglucosaminyltransferase [Gordonia sp. (in: high G+C Gram-positive bacteria)]
MRFAVHVLVHEHPRLFAALIASLQHEQIDVYAHVDDTSRQDLFESAARAVGAEVVFVPQPRRVNVRWGGLSLVRATRELVELAVGSGVDHHRHTLLSGADVLLRPLPVLLERWSDDAEHLRIDRRLNRTESQGYLKPRRFWFPDQPVLDRAWLSGRVPRRLPPGPPLVEGSQWWSLTSPAIRTILDYLDDHPAWLRGHRFSLCPDEFVFHSILAASGLAPKITQNYLDRTPPDDTLHALHFIDWSEYSGIRPAELTEQSLTAALASPAMFARKVGADWTWRAEQTC